MQDKLDRKADGSEKEIGDQQNGAKQNVVPMTLFIRKDFVDVVRDVREAIRRRTGRGLILLVFNHLNLGIGFWHRILGDNEASVWSLARTSFGLLQEMLDRSSADGRFSEQLFSNPADRLGVGFVAQQVFGFVQHSALNFF